MVISIRLALDPKRLPRCARALKDGEDILKKYSWGAMTGCSSPIRDRAAG